FSRPLGPLSLAVGMKSQFASEGQGFHARRPDVLKITSRKRLRNLSGGDEAPPLRTTSFSSPPSPADMATSSFGPSSDSTQSITWTALCVQVRFEQARLAFLPRSRR